MVPFSSKREIQVGDSFSLFNIYPYIYHEIMSILSYLYNPRSNTNFFLLKVNTTCPSVFCVNSRTCTRFKQSSLFVSAPLRIVRYMRHSRSSSVDARSASDPVAPSSELSPSSSLQSVIVYG